MTPKNFDTSILIILARFLFFCFLSFFFDTSNPQPTNNDGKSTALRRPFLFLGIIQYHCFFAFLHVPSFSTLALAFCTHVRRCEERKGRGNVFIEVVVIPGGNL